MRARAVRTLSTKRDPPATPSKKLGDNALHAGRSVRPHAVRHHMSRQPDSCLRLARRMQGRSDLAQGPCPPPFFRGP